MFVLSILDGEGGAKIGDALNEGAIGVFFFIWWFTNHKVAGVEINIWEKIEEFGSQFGLQKILDCASLGFTLSLTTGAYHSGLSGKAWGKFYIFDRPFFVPMIRAVAVACASDFFPLNKGINFKSCSSMAFKAFIVVLFVHLLTISPLYNKDADGDGTVDADANAGGAEGGAGGGDGIKVPTPTQVMHLWALVMFLLGPVLPEDKIFNAVTDVLYKATNLQRA